MNITQRIDKAIDYIGKHIDEKLTIDQISNIACLSQYHFHRLFTAYTGLSLHQLIRWLRLKRAAHQLITERDKKIIDIALSAGFASHEAFSRAFKLACGQNPSQFRRQSSWHHWDTPPYSWPIKGERMDVSIISCTKKSLAAIKHQGDARTFGNTVNKLITWAKAQPIDVKPRAGEAYCFAYNDPDAVPVEQFQADLAIQVPDSFNVSGDAFKTVLPAGRYAVAKHIGSRSNISETVYSMYRNWLPHSHEEPGELPIVFRYQNFDQDVAETELVTEVMLLLK